MPYRSEAQRRWAHTPTGMKALGGKKAVEEWDRETKGKDLPERAGKGKKTDRQKIAEAMAEAERRRAERGSEKKAR